MSDYIPKIMKEGAELTSPSLIASVILTNNTINQQENIRQSQEADRQADTAEAITNVENATSLANTATDNANVATLSANNAATDANSAADNANAIAEELELETLRIYQNAVNTYADIASTYPAPSNGWTVAVLDEETDYRYNGTTHQWVNIGNTGGGGTTYASDVVYDNADSGLEAINVQEAIDEVKSEMGNLNTLDTSNKTDLVSSINEVNNGKLSKSNLSSATTGQVYTKKSDGTAEFQNPTGGNASSTSYSNSVSGLNSTDVQGAIDEIVKQKIYVNSTMSTSAINAKMTSNAEVYFRAGSYSVDAGADTFGGLKPANNSRWIFMPGSTLNVITNSYGHYACVDMNSVENFEMINPVIIGDRTTHTGSTGEWGHDIVIRNNCKNIRIYNPICSNAWGDGIFIGESDGIPTNIRIYNPICDNNRRNNMSITQGKDVIICNGRFLNANGTSPQKGVDIEPTLASDIIQGIKIISCYAYGNVSAGYSVSAMNSSTNYMDIQIINCKDESNGTSLIIEGNQSTAGNILVEGFESINSSNSGIKIQDNMIPVTIYNSHILNCNQGSGTDVKYGSGLVINTYNSGKNCGNVRVRNLRIDSFDDKMLCAYDKTYTGGSGTIYTTDVEIFTNVTSNSKQVKMNGANANYSGIQNAKVTSEPIYSATATIGTSTMPLYIYQKINNLGATGAITLLLDSASSYIKGITFEFEVESAQNMVVSTGSSGVNIYPGGVTSLTSNVIGSRLKLKSTGVRWQIEERIGTWT